MKVLICGVDGYLGWALAQYLTRKGHSVKGIDNLSRRKFVKEVGGKSLTKVYSVSKRKKHFKKYVGDIEIFQIDLRDYSALKKIIKKWTPDAIVNFGQMPSAPYSMIDYDHAVFTQNNNVNGNLSLIFAMKELCPDAHLVKLGCFDDETEILTKNGWKKFSDLDEKDAVATRTEDNKTIEFKVPKKIYDFDYDGKMYGVKNNRLDMLVTPNHRVFTVKRSNRTYGPLKLEIPENIFGRASVYDISADWHDDCPETIELAGRPVSSVTAMRFLGWWIAEGYASSNRGIIKQSRKYEEKHKIWIDDMVALATEMDLPYSIYDEKNTECDVFSIRDKHFANWLIQFGNSHTKYLPSFVKNLGKTLLREFIETYMLGDGSKHHRGLRSYTKSKQLSDDIQEIGLKCGWASTISQKDEGYVNSFSMSQYCHINHYKEKQNDYWQENYNGKVYCVEIGDGHGIILVRRHGKPFWSGNTMGEYGTPEIPIAEGFFEIEYGGKKDRVMYPRLPGSFYHATKVHDSVNIDFANRVWGLTCTDIMQGVVYGTYIPGMEQSEVLKTRFDYDGVFGTAINRFVAQAIVGHPLTLFGKGHQKRGFLPLKDSMQCISLIIEKPPTKGEYRVLNQLEEVYDLTELAERVSQVASEFGLDTSISHIENPRVEKDDHFYEVEHSTLLSLGYKPTSDMMSELRVTFADLIPLKDRIVEKCILPNIKWRK